MVASNSKYLDHFGQQVLNPHVRTVEPSKGDKGFSTGEVRGVNPDARTVTGRLSTPTPDRYEEIVLPSAFAKWLPTFQENPKFLPNHSHGDRGGKPSSIGHWEDLQITKDALDGRAKFLPPGDPLLLADAWWFRFLHGSQRTFSVAWITHEWEMQEFDVAEGVKKRIRVFTEVELIEISAVEIPANRDALLRAAGFNGEQIGKVYGKGVSELEDMKSAIKEVIEQAYPHLTEQKQTDLIKTAFKQVLSDPDGPVVSIAEEAARSVLAGMGHGDDDSSFNTNSAPGNTKAAEAADPFGSVFG